MTLPSPSVASVFGELCDRPLAIIFAASRVAPMRWVVAQEHIQILDAEETPDAGNLDMKIWKWFCHLLDFFWHCFPFLTALGWKMSSLIGLATIF